ncbi:SRPBCC family protein [Leifsonia poae]|uniref:SRPBCC family protein n=1 Tax=Leifsonia poae TaxID=110933 RepID=UPI003D67B6A5
MVQFTNEIDIGAPVQDVYDALRAIDAYPTWLRHSTVYRGTKAGKPSGHPESTYEDHTTVGRMPGELVEDVPFHTLRFHQAKPSGSLDARIRYTVDVTESGTHLTRVGEMTTHGMLRMMQPVLIRMAAMESERTLKALKLYVEQHAR